MSKSAIKIEKKELSGVTIENRIYNSTNVIKTSYNYNTGRLFITFKNKSVYQYFDIPLKTYEQIVESDSIGKEINTTLKRFKFSKMAIASDVIVNELLLEVKTITPPEELKVLPEKK